MELSTIYISTIYRIITAIVTGLSLDSQLYWIDIEEQVQFPLYNKKTLIDTLL